MGVQTVKKFISEVVTYLSSQGLSPIEKAFMPSTPDTYTAVYPGGGPDLVYPARTLRIQVLCRSDNPETAVDNACLAYESLHDLWTSVSSPFIPSFPGIFKKEHEVGPSYLDDNGRKVYSLNFYWKGVEK